MKKVVTFAILILFLTSFIFANSITSRVTENNEDDQENQTQARILTQAQVQEIKQETKRLRVHNQTCPANCTCTGSTVKCPLEGGGREMTVTAGRSGNIIVQVKNANASTNVTLYRHEGKVFGVFKDNETRELRVMPDMVKEKVRERVERELEDEEIELDEEGVYQYRARKKVRLFGFIRTMARVRAEINSETGELERIRNSWWAFLASDDSESIVGAGCGTVTPDSRDECCMNKGYDRWNEETAECEFSD